MPAMWVAAKTGHWDRTIPVLSTPASPNTTSNHSYDILQYGCWDKFETVACIRNGILTFLATLTAVLCIVKVVRLHIQRHQTCHQYLIFYCASLECVVGSVHWAIGSWVQFEFVLQYLKLLQFIIMGHFYWTLATRALRREKIAERFIIPFLLLTSVYFTVITILGIINVQSTWIECLQPYWIELSSAELVIVQLFAVAGFYITRRLNEISTLDSVRWSQKRDLWCIVFVFEISALTTFLYDLTVIILGDEDSGCSAIFLYTQQLYSPVFVVFIVLKLLLPIWVMLFVFQPTPPVLDREDLVPALSDEGTFTSGYNEDQQYRQLYYPSDDYNSINGPAQIIVAHSNGSSSLLHRNASNLGIIQEEERQATHSSSSPDGGTQTRCKFFL